MSTGAKKKSKFTRKQLRASQGILTQQTKTNVYASQAGMTTYGAVRHGPDIRADDTVKDSQCLLTQQTKTNIYDSQKGMTPFAAVRHGADIRVTELYDEVSDSD